MLVLALQFLHLNLPLFLGFWTFSGLGCWTLLELVFELLLKFSNDAEQIQSYISLHFSYEG